MSVGLLSFTEASHDWRIIELWSKQKLPWEANIEWSVAGASPGPTLLLSVAHATRLSLMAQSMNIIGINQADSINDVCVSVCNGFTQSSNQYDLWRYCDGSTPTSIPVPPYAARMEIMLENRSAIGMTAVTLIAANNQRVTTLAGAIPAAGLPVGGIQSIDVLTPVSMVFRVTFYLTL